MSLVCSNVVFAAWSRMFWSSLSEFGVHGLFLRVHFPRCAIDSQVPCIYSPNSICLTYQVLLFVVLCVRPLSSVVPCSFFCQILLYCCTVYHSLHASALRLVCFPFYFLMSVSLMFLSLMLPSLVSLSLMFLPVVWLSLMLAVPCATASCVAA